MTVLDIVFDYFAILYINILLHNIMTSIIDKCGHAEGGHAARRNGINQPKKNKDNIYIFIK
jgi:hypothetical protein